MQLAHPKVGTRLGIGFAIVLALLVLSIVLGLGAMHRIGQRTHDIIYDKNVKMAAANRMLDNIRNITLSPTNIVVVPSAAEVDAQLAKIGESRKKYGAARKILIEHAADDQERP